MACDPIMPDKLEKARLEGAQSQLGQASVKVPIVQTDV
jgi:hypothetical protein